MKCRIVSPQAIDWERLDRFEGPGYKRWIVPVETDSGIVIANVYVASGLMG